MNLKKKFICNGILMSIVNLSMRTVTLYFSAFILSRVGEEGVGLFTLLMNVFSFAVTFVSAGVSLSVTSLIAAEVGVDAARHRQKILRAALLYCSVISLIATLALLLLSLPLCTHLIGDTRALIPLRILTLSLFPIAMCSVYGGYFVAVRRVPLNAAVQVFSQLLKIILTVLVLPARGVTDVGEGMVRLCAVSTLCELAGFVALSLLFLFCAPRLPKEQTAACRTPSKLGAFLGVTVPLALSAYIRQALLTLEHSMIPKRLLKFQNTTMDKALADYGAFHGMALPLLLYPLSPLSSFSGLLVPEFAELQSCADKRRMSSIASRALSYTLSYAAVVCVFLFVFSEELSCLIYKTPSAAVHLFVLAPVVPLMYLDHVTDAMLKGIGEHVYSMWVNITDSLLSIVLLYFLLPHLGITGYAIVILAMEGYNFTLSMLRLSRRVKLRVPFVRTMVLPLACALFAALITNQLFLLNGSTTPYLFFFFKLIFFLAIFFFFYRILTLKKAKISL